MRSLDAFGRPLQEFQVRTGCGGCLSVGSLCAVALLFLSELRYFLELDLKDETVIDQNQDQKHLNITLNITLPEVPCAVLSMNLMNPKKGNVMHVAHDIYKTRLSPGRGRALGVRVRDSLLDVAQTPQELAEAAGGGTTVRTTHSTAHLRCHSCFQSHEDEDDCCSTCEQVRSEYRNRGLNDRPADLVFGQCVEEAYARDGPLEREGCRVEASLHVRKVPATLHLGVSRHFRPELVPGASLNAMAYVSSLSFSHEISALTFGPDFPGLVRVLDGRRKERHEDMSSEHYQYDVHIIPTRYREDGDSEVSSHQYSVTEYVKSVREGAQELPLGVVLSYDFTPFEVRVTRSRKSLLHFLTECCAIVGGVFAFSGMLDNFAYQMQKSAGARRGGARVELSAMSSSGLG
jgi:hypothetical protein